MPDLDRLLALPFVQITLPIVLVQSVLIVDQVRRMRKDRRRHQEVMRRWRDGTGG